MLSSSIAHYNEHGWALETGSVPETILVGLRSRGLELRNYVESRLALPAPYGTDTHWKGVSCASMYSGSTLNDGYVLDGYLKEFYQSQMMYDHASQLLGTDDVWLFNDQMVMKLPGCGLGFYPHYDNQYGGPENIDGNMHTVNICVILDDFTETNGKIAIQHSDGEWLELLPTSGSLLAINGNTYHQSEPNVSSAPRGLYACVYSEGMITLHNFYRERFLTKYSL